MLFCCPSVNIHDRTTTALSTCCHVVASHGISPWNSTSQNVYFPHKCLPPPWQTASSSIYTRTNFVQWSATGTVYTLLRLVWMKEYSLEHAKICATVFIKHCIFNWSSEGSCSFYVYLLTSLLPLPPLEYSLLAELSRVSSRLLWNISF